jgi:putative component of membrane protein insertase Oxa1/YidC/SpoIIIJ protein YidD
MRYLVLVGLWVYRKFLSRYTSACPEQECCSAYAVRMVKEHGATIGLELALERVRNCGVQMPSVR